MSPRASQDPSLQRVDDALRRLNDTLASYSIPKNQADGVQAGASSYSSADEKLSKEDIDDMLNQPNLFAPRMDLKSTSIYPEVTNKDLRAKLNRLYELHDFLQDWPYSIELHTEIAGAYVALGYPDLAVGAAYKGLLLIDAFNDESDDYYEDALEDAYANVRRQPLRLRFSVIRDHPVIQARYQPDSMKVDDEGMRIIPEPEHDELEIWVKYWWGPTVYGYLAQCLHACGCHKSAYKYCQLGLQALPDDKDLLDTRQAVTSSVIDHFRKTRGPTKPGDSKVSKEDWPDEGMVRRECYPWNIIEPDRFSKDSLDFLNTEMSKVAPHLEVCVTDLPNLSSTTPGGSKPVKQLGVFAKTDVPAGQIVLDESSLLAVNNRLQDALCDACSADLPSLADLSKHTSTVYCPSCAAIFCSSTCYDQAMESYHPALCDKDVDSLARDVPPAQAANSLYILLLQRALAMAVTQEVHPLWLKETRYIWGDYHTHQPLSSHFRQLKRVPGADPFLQFPRTLPFSFDANVVLPYHILTKMDVNIFEEHRHFDVWVFNTLYAKFRGTASARLSGLQDGGRIRGIRGPEVSAVHPLWCLANHSCDPNVAWEWGGRMKFWCREERVEWKKGEGTEENGKEKTKSKQAAEIGRGDVGVAAESQKRSRLGIKKGEEILNHYCDIDLPVKERREWAVGALGGLCRCERCVWEAGETI